MGPLYDLMDDESLPNYFKAQNGWRRGWAPRRFREITQIGKEARVQ